MPRRWSPVEVGWDLSSATVAATVAARCIDVERQPAAAVVALGEKGGSLRRGSAPYLRHKEMYQEKRTSILFTSTMVWGSTRRACPCRFPQFNKHTARPLKLTLREDSYIDPIVAKHFHIQLLSLRGTRRRLSRWLLFLVALLSFDHLLLPRAE